MGEFITYNYKGQPTLNKKWGLIPITEKHVPSSNWQRTKDGEYFRYLDKERTKTQWAPKGLRIYDKNSGMTAIIGDDYRAKRYLVSKKSVGTTPKPVASAGKKDSNGGGGTKARVAIRKPRPTNVVLPGYTKPDDITDIKAFQENYLSENLKRYGADGIWGAETQAAYNKWKANNEANRATLINSVQPKTTISDTSFNQPIDWTRNSFRPTFKLPERPLQHITDMYFGNSYRPYTFVNPILQQLRTPKIETTVPKIPAVQATQYVLSEIPSLATPEYVPTLNFNNPKNFR